MKTQTDVTDDGSTERMTPSLQRRAIRSFLNATAQEIRTYPIGDGFGLDLSRESCICCAGFFPKTGEVTGWYTDDVLVYSHVGCATFDIRHWDKDLEPDHGVVRACSCVDGCGRCGGAGDLGPVDEGQARKRTAGKGGPQPAATDAHDARKSAGTAVWERAARRRRDGQSCDLCGHDHSVKSRDRSYGDYMAATPGHEDFCDCAGPVGCVSHRGDPDMAFCAACREVERG